MTTNNDANKRTPSTTWAWRKVKIGQPPQALAPQSGFARPQRPTRGRDPRKPLTITIVYRGGSEAWWEVRARGLVLRRPGHSCLHDVLSALQQ